MHAHQDLKSRRDALKHIGGSAFAILAASSQPAFARGRDSVVRGRVLDASYANRPHGIPGVLVSNGRDVVVTDRRGAYRLPVRDGDVVFAIKPAHWTYEADTGVPRLGYLVRSARQDALSGPCIVPTIDGGASSADFRFRPSPERDDFDVLLFTDTHVGDTRELGYVRDMITHGLETTRAAFAIHHGDALADNFDMFGPYRDMLAESGCLWHHCAGNHDMRLGMSHARAGLDAWIRNIGPAHYAFRSGRATFIILNNVEDLGPRIARHDPRPYRGAIARDQLRFVANVLAHVPKKDLVVISMHIPLVSYANPDAATDTTVNRVALMRLLAGRPNTISFAGHSHTTEHHYLGASHGFEGSEPHHHQVLTAACGSWWSGPIEENGVPVAVSRDGSPKGHHVLSIRGTHAETRFVPYRPKHQVRALVEERRLLGISGVSTALVNGRLVVNVFDGGPKTRVTCRIGDSTARPLALAHTPSEDPFVVETFARERALLKPWVYPTRCSHLWTLDLPGDLNSGSHVIKVHIEGEFGQLYDHELTIAV